jgi:hypothetical protein
MMYKLLMAKEMYHEKDDAGEIEELKKLGFTFEDWGNGFFYINGSPKIYVSEGDFLGHFLIRFGGLEMTRDGEIKINNFSILPSYVGDGEEQK